MKNNNRGFLKTLLLLVIALALLKFVFDIDIIEIIKSPKAKETIDYIVNLFKLVWDYVWSGVMFVWEKIFGLVSRSRS